MRSPAPPAQSTPWRNRAGPGDGGSGHPAAVVTGRIDGEATPAGADLQQMIVGAECQPLADGTQLGLLSLFQAGLCMGVDGTRVLHMAVEKTLIEGVAEIVVGGDVERDPVRVLRLSQ